MQRKYCSSRTLDLQEEQRPQWSAGSKGSTKTDLQPPHARTSDPCRAQRPASLLPPLSQHCKDSARARRIGGLHLSSQCSRAGNLFHKLMPISNLYREVSFFSGQNLMQRIITDQSTESSWLNVNSKRDHLYQCSPPARGSGNTEEAGQERI